MLIGSLCVLAGVFFFCGIMPARTQLGRKLLDNIAGFTLYLKTAETHRLEALYPNIAEKIPEHTPELFEKILPYALALDTAKTWADGFAAQLGRAYIPDWYRTSSGDPFKDLVRMTDRDLSLRLSSAVRSGMVSTAKSVSSHSWSSGSGLGGGGSSGGGRGGGGGRGW